MLLEWWKAERKNLEELCEGFCGVVEVAAETGAKFWLTSPNEPSTPFLYAQLSGCQNRIDAYNTILSDRLDPDTIDEIENCLAQLYKALTGDDPQKENRDPSLERACAVHICASAAVTAIRRAEFARLSLRERLYRFTGQCWPNDRQPMVVQFKTFKNDNSAAGTSSQS